MDSERGAVVDFPLGAETPTVVTVVARLSDDVVTPLGERVYEALVDCVEPTPAPVPTPTETPSSTPTAPPSQNGGDTAPISTPASSGVTTPVEQVEPPKLKPTVTLSSTAASAGGNVTVKARGFAPGEEVEIWLHSDPWKLADAVADANGTLTLRVGIAGGTDLGAHRIEVRGASSGSAYVKMFVNDDLAITGIDSAFASGVATTGVVLVLGGAAVFLLARRARLIANC
jgi:hypothetical protein